MCPRSALGEDFVQADMTILTYKRISEAFQPGQLVWLQGWGEPLLNPALFTMIAMAKQKGCSVGLTTSGMLLTHDVSQKLLALGINALAVSMAGATKATHESIRVNTSYDTILKHAADFARLRGQMDRDLKLVLTFLRTVDNYQELPAVINVAKQLGFDEVVATNLDYIPCEPLDRLRVFDRGGRIGLEAQRTLEAAAKQAKTVGIILHSYSLQRVETPVCPENPTSSVFISYDGSVSPCVYLNLPTISARIPRVFDGRRHLVRKTIFGNVNVTGLQEIWQNSPFEQFRLIYGKRALNRQSDVTSVAGAFLDGLTVASDNSLLTPMLPEVCRTCNKAYGI
jgi:MoaA/NifB/PqqE/SkfB family radical SAM enzyme